MTTKETKEIQPQKRSFQLLQVAAIISGLHEPGALLHSGERQDRTSILANFFNTTLNTHNYWAIRMFFCELLFLVNVIANIFLIDAFLGGEFSSYGIEVLFFIRQNPQHRTDPMSRLGESEVNLKSCFQSLPSSYKMHLRKVRSVRHN